MKRELQLYFFVTEEIASHKRNAHLDLVPGSFINYDDPDVEEKECPEDTSEGYYIKSGGQCVFVRYS